MKMLMERISPFVEIVIFEEETILNAPIEEWPIVDVLMGWYSDGTFGWTCLHRLSFGQGDRLCGTPKAVLSKRLVDAKNILIQFVC